MTAFTEQAYPSATPKPTTARPTYVLTLQATPGRDDIEPFTRIAENCRTPATACACFPFASCHHRLGISAQQAADVVGPLTGNSGVPNNRRIVPQATRRTAGATDPARRVRAPGHPGRVHGVCIPSRQRWLALPRRGRDPQGHGRASRCPGHHRHQRRSVLRARAQGVRRPSDTRSTRCPCGARCGRCGGCGGLRPG